MFLLGTTEKSPIDCLHGSIKLQDFSQNICCLSSIGRECLKEVNQDMDGKKGSLGGALRRGADLSGLRGACKQHSGHLKSSVCPQNSSRMRWEFQSVRRLRTCCRQTSLAP